MRIQYNTIVKNHTYLVVECIASTSLTAHGYVILCNSLHNTIKFDNVNKSEPRVQNFTMYVVHKRNKIAKNIIHACIYFEINDRMRSYFYALIFILDFLCPRED